MEHGEYRAGHSLRTRLRRTEQQSEARRWAAYETYVRSLTSEELDEELRKLEARLGPHRVAALNTLLEKERANQHEKTP